MQYRPGGSILNSVNELDNLWSEMLAKAAAKAREGNRHGVADYLDLKASNDLIRSAGLSWLFQALIQHAATANRSRPPIDMERTEPHSFRFKGANIVGASLSFRYGVRCLTVEAGWTRTPADGFIRGGSLAIARLKHFGLPKANADLGLTMGEDSPVWRLLIEEKHGKAIDSDYLLSHVNLLAQA
mgnify:CR=1 FL=1